MMIIGYLRQERNFFVQDMGSVHGTFVLLRHGKARTLHKGQTYQVGSSEIYLNIIDARLPRQKYNDEEENSKKLTRVN